MRACVPAALLAAALFGCNAEPQASAVPAAAPETVSASAAPSGLPLAPLQIRSGGRTHSFTVEVAQTPEEQAQGLMFRKRVGPNEGMLFPFNPPKRASFWMKNTLIALDLVFIRSDGTIESIAANAVPHSLDSIFSRGPVVAVLELAGGRAAELGLKEGDQVTWTGGPGAR
jgi:uncharacterized membrane protein (UPF0127 family)